MYYYTPVKTHHRFNNIIFYPDLNYTVEDEYVGWSRDGYDFRLMYLKFTFGGKIPRNVSSTEYLQID